MKKTTYSTIIEAVSGLQGKGYSAGFVLLGSKLFCLQHKMFLRPDEFQVKEVYTFQQDGGTQETLVYAIECAQYLLRGILLEQRLQDEFSLN